MAPAKTAMATDPKTPPLSKRGTWQFNGQWVDKEGYKVDGYGKRLANQTKPFVPAKQNPFAPKASTPTTQGPAAPAAPTPQQQIQGGLEGLVQEGIGDVRNFDPNTFQQQYQPQFEQGMQRAYDTIYGQFERKNQEQFARQNEQLQQSLVERGLDPNSPAYQALTRQLADQQNTARQDAQNAAWQAAQGYQQQGYQQATGTALLPSQMASPYLDLYGQQQGLQFTGSEAEKQRQWQARQNQLEMQNRLKLAQMTKGGGGGGSNADEAALAARIMAGYGPQQGGGQSIVNAGIAGAAQGGANAFINQLMKPAG